MQATLGGLAVRPLILVLGEDPAVAILPIVAAAERAVERIIFGATVDQAAIGIEEFECDVCDSVAAVAAHGWIVCGGIEGQLVVELAALGDGVSL